MTLEQRTTFKPLPILIPSRTAMIHAITAASLFALSVECKRPLGLETFTGEGVAQSRTGAVQEVAKNLGSMKPFRGLFIDDDIILPQQSIPKLARSIEFADNRNLNIVAPVKLLNGRYNINKTYEKDSTMNDEEVKALPDFARIRIAGLGFYYGLIDPNYQFRVGFNSKANKFCGEDWNFFLDNNLPLNVLKGLNLGHVKENVLWSEV